jgi:transcriptional regulator with PAS, ATPase and Fis domain
MIERVAPTDTTVIILGESGVGKEVVAKAIHTHSHRRNKQFLPINCAALPEALLESELFGHVKGAFTSAVSSKRGLLEEANGGTVLLDEIGDLSTMLQVKLLRVLEDREIRPIGGVKNVHVDLRVICATNRDIERAVKEGRFREDLYYRINTVTIKLPPLRERKEDIEPLLTHFIEHYSWELVRQAPSLTPEALDALRNYHWPGNVRELQNVIERAILVCENGVITLCDLPESMKGVVEMCDESFAEKLSIEDYSKAFIQKYQAQYTEHELAEMLGITRKALWEKRKRWGIGRHAERQK